jgi:integrase/recombinase XerD
MQSPIPTVSPLRQRMLEDMRLRQLAPRTQAAYVRAVRRFTRFLGHSPDTATDEDLRRFQPLAPRLPPSRFVRRPTL